MISRSRLVQLLGAAGFAYGIVLATLLASAEFERDQGVWIGLTLVIGWGWVGAGTFAGLRRPDNGVGLLMIATGFAFYVMVGERTDVAALFTAGIALESLFAATAVHLLLAFPSGRLRGGFDRVLVAAAYVAVTIGSVVPTMFVHPAAHGCFDCPSNLILIENDHSFAERWFEGLAVVGIAILGATLVLIARRWRRASPPLRRAVTLVFVAGGALMMLLAALLTASLADSSLTVIDIGWYAALAPFGLLPYLFIGSLIRARMLRGGAVGSLVATIGETPGPGDLRDALATALGDPSLELAYWLPASEQYVDAQGRRVELPPSRSSRAVHRVELDGVQVAAIVHDATLLDDPELVEAAGGAAALALERERLDAELRAKVEELSESRARMIKFGMAERRRIERDLHDGAQQRLVSLALDLRLARETVRTDPDRADELLGSAADELTEALEELRELARGIHPALLSERGLAPAIEALARRAPLPVEVDSRLNGGISEAAELAAYFVVSEALTNVVRYARASRAVVTIEQRNDEPARGSLLVAVADDGVGGAALDGGTGLRGLADRISSLGGRFEVDSPSGDGTTVRARIPLD